MRLPTIQMASGEEQIAHKVCKTKINDISIEFSPYWYQLGWVTPLIADPSGSLVFQPVLKQALVSIIFLYQDLGFAQSRAFKTQKILFYKQQF